MLTPEQKLGQINQIESQNIMSHPLLLLDKRMNVWLEAYKEGNKKQRMNAKEMRYVKA